MMTYLAAMQLLDTVINTANRYELAVRIDKDTFDWFHEALIEKGFRTTSGPGHDGETTTLFIHDALMRDGEPERFEGPIDACRAIDPEKYPFSIDEVAEAARKVLPKVLVRPHWHKPGETPNGADFMAMSEEMPNARIVGVIDDKGKVVEARVQQRLPSFQWSVLETSYQAGAQSALRTFCSLLQLR